MPDIENLKLEAERIRNVAVAQLSHSVPYGMAPDIVDAIVATVHAQIAVAQGISGGGWIYWGGHGGHPVSENDTVEVKYRDGETETSTGWGSDRYWRHDGLPGDIIAYRIVKSADGA